MDATALLLSRIQFGFTISFHIIFPAFTIGLAAWLTVLEALHLRTGKQVYRVLFDFWLKIFGIAFGLGVVSGVVMGFQFGTNWSELSKMSGPIQGPLLSYETFTAFMLEASFFGILVFGRNRVRPGFYLFSTAMVALGTTLSAFWIMINNSWMQVPVGYVLQNGIFVPDDWLRIIFNQVAMVRFVHMLLAAYLSSAFCVAATGAWYMLRNIYHAEARVMLRMGLFLAAVLLPVQLVFGHLVGDYVHQHQPAKFAAIECGSLGLGYRRSIISKPGSCIPGFPIGLQIVGKNNNGEAGSARVGSTRTQNQQRKQVQSFAIGRRTQINQDCFTVEADLVRKKPAECGLPVEDGFHHAGPGLRTGGRLDVDRQAKPDFGCDEGSENVQAENTSNQDG